jgi:hypothetical protein
VGHLPGEASGPRGLTGRVQGGKLAGEALRLASDTDPEQSRVGRTGTSRQPLRALSRTGESGRAIGATTRRRRDNLASASALRGQVGFPYRKPCAKACDCPRAGLQTEPRLLVASNRIGREVTTSACKDCKNRRFRYVKSTFKVLAALPVLLISPRHSKGPSHSEAHNRDQT